MKSAKRARLRDAALRILRGAFAIALCCGASPPSPAAGGDAFDLVAGYTLTGQWADDGRLDSDRTGSLDAVFGWERGPGRLELYVEGNTSLRDSGVATLVPASNADAGTALDPDRSGRFQVSELKYRLGRPDGPFLTGGLIDPSAYLDATRINNDENMQFLAAPFVNNPTIDFPDYTLGLAGRLVSRGPGGGPTLWNLVLASSNGIADNPNLSFSQAVDIAEEDKGVFAGVEAAWPSESRFFRLVRLGAWARTSDHETLDGRKRDAGNSGAYAAIGLSAGRSAVNVRLGVADPDVSTDAAFASAGFQSGGDRLVFGLAAGRSWLSSESPRRDAGDRTHAEAYARFRIARKIWLTPSAQYVVNSGFDASGRVVDDNVWIFALRLHHVAADRRWSRGGG